MNPKEEIMIYLLGKIVSIISKGICFANINQIITHYIILKKTVSLENINAIKKYLPLSFWNVLYYIDYLKLHLHPKFNFDFPARIPSICFYV